MRDDQDPLGIAYDVDRWQRILNEQPIPPRTLQQDGHIRVRARLVWERDGEQMLDTIASAWTNSVVLVELADRRSRFRGVWLVPADVERAE